MAEIQYCDNQSGSLSVRVNLKNASNVFLVDQQNFNLYKSGQDYRYFGGYYEQTPVNITVNGAGRWFLIVEDSDYSFSWL